MSLIDEALKRAQASHQNEPQGDGGARPWTPAPLPDRSQANRRRALQIGIFAALAIVIVGGLLLMRHAGRGLPAEGSAKAGQGRFTPAPAAAAAPLEEVQVAPPPGAVSDARPTRAPAALAQKGGAPQAGPGTLAPAPAVAAAPPGRPSPALVNNRTYVGTAVLPDGTRIELGGIVYSESNPTAVMNGRIVGAGSYVEGFAVVRIEPTRVELEGNGLTIFLALK